MKKALFILFFGCLGANVFAQKITMEYATVNFYDKFRWNFSQTDIDQKTKQIHFSNKNGKLYATLLLKNYGSETFCSAVFPEYKLKYEGYYPANTTLKEILFFWDEYNTVTDTVLSLPNLQEYCKNAGYRLKPMQ